MTHGAKLLPRMLPMLLASMLAGCMGDSNDSAPPKQEAQASVASAPPLPAAPVAEAPPQPANASVLVTDVRPADRPALGATDAAHPLDLPPSSDAAPADPFPREVTDFMVDRDGCDHFRGEEPYDADRRAYLAESIAELCTGTDARLAVLKQRYAKDQAVMAALGHYEDRIEAP